MSCLIWVSISDCCPLDVALPALPQSPIAFPAFPGSWIDKNKVGWAFAGKWLHVCQSNLCPGQNGNHALIAGFGVFFNGAAFRSNDVIDDVDTLIFLVDVLPFECDQLAGS